MPFVRCQQAGRRMIPLVIQFDGSLLASRNCFAAEGAMLVAFETGGQKHPSAAEFRANVRNLDASGNPTTPDVSGGGRPTQIVETAKRAYGVTLDYRVMPFEDAYKLGFRDDVMAGFSISYAPVSGSALDGSPGFTGLHGIDMTGGEVYDPLADGRLSHGIRVPNGPQKWPKALLRKAAGTYAGVGEGRAAVILAYAPAVKPKRYSVRLTRGAVWTYPAGSVVHHDEDRVDIRKDSSAPCTTPFLTRWTDGQKRVVEVTAGYLAGKRLEPGATHVTLVGS